MTTAVQNEFRIIKHLATKIPVDTEGYKPTEGQRTTLELLQYLSYIFAGVTKAIEKNDNTVYGPYIERSLTTTIENFAERMTEQEQDLVTTLSEFTDEDLQTIINLVNSLTYTKIRPNRLLLLKISPKAHLIRKPMRGEVKQEVFRP